MSSKNDINHRNYMQRIKDLLKCYNKNIEKTPLLTEKLSAEISLIPELVDYIKSNDPYETKVLLSQFSAFMQIKELSKGFCFQRILEDNLNNNFIMILKGNVAEFGIKYVKKSLSFREYFVLLTKLFLLKEKGLYWDCMKKNVGSFPFDKFRDVIKNIDNKHNLEEEKNINDKNFLRDINILEIGKDIHTKDLYFIEELEKLKEIIRNSKWKKYIQNNNIIHNENYEDITNSFLELYNYNDKIDNNKEIETSLKNTEKYKVYIPYFFIKGIISPISFIGDLNNPFQTKNYSGFVTLEKCFILYINKSKINQDQLIFKYSHFHRFKHISEILLSTHQIFKYINSSNLSKFGKYFQLIHLNKDEILFHQGELNRGVFLIINGIVELITNQSYINLIDLNYKLLHSMDYCNQYISDIKKKEISTSKNLLNGYYSYDSELNNLMKSPLFSKNSKIKEDITFGTYKIKDILGLGEIFNYKNNINLFTAKAQCDNTELVFIPREIFQALLSNNSVNKKCGTISEEKTKLLRESISKYKNFFEKKITILSGRKNTNKKIKAKSFILRNNSNTFIQNLMNKSNKNEIEFTPKKTNINSNTNNYNYINKISENNNSEKNNINNIEDEKNMISSYMDKNNLKLENKTNKNKISFQKLNDYLFLREQLISIKHFKNYLMNNQSLNKTSIGFNKNLSFLNSNSKFNKKNLFLFKNNITPFKSGKKKIYLGQISNEKKSKINFRCASAKRLENSNNFKYKSFFNKNENLNKSSFNLNKANDNNKLNRNILFGNFINKKSNKLE